MIIYDPMGNPLLNVEVDNNSYRYMEIMGTNEIVLNFSLTEHHEIPLGAFIVFREETYTLATPENVKIVHNRDYEYSVTFGGSAARLGNYRIHNMMDGRLKFDLVDKAEAHLNLILDNLNEREDPSGMSRPRSERKWVALGCIESTQKLISYNHNTPMEALNAIANTFETEWEVIGTTIKIGKVEYGKDNALPLGYGAGKGFNSGVSRTNGDSLPIQKLYVQGGSDNIIASRYGSVNLVLPKGVSFSFDGEYFEGEPKYNAEKGRTFITDDKGFCLSVDGAPANAVEDSLDLSDLYAKREGEVTSVYYLWVDSRGVSHYCTYDELMALPLPPTTDADWEKVQVDIVDSTIPESLDYSKEEDYPAGEHLSVIFQSGGLSGREFDAKFIKKPAAGSTRPSNRFELIKASIDGVNMPTKGFLPHIGDKYATFGFYLPSEYYSAIREDGTREGAEWDMAREAAKYLYEHMTPRYVFSGTLDGQYAKRNWETIKDRLALGYHIEFTNASVQPEPFKVRIISLKEFINIPYKPEITLSNETKTSGLTSSLKSVEADAVHSELRIESTRAYYRRRSFLQAQEIMDAIEKAFGDEYSESINPATINTMGLLVGSPNTQFKIYRPDFSAVINLPFVVQGGTLILHSFGIRHFTLNRERDNVMRPSYDESEYPSWVIEEQTLTFGEAGKAYYLYANVKNEGQSTCILSSTPLSFVAAGGWNLLIGIFSTKYEGIDRSFAPVYGYTQILPNQILTGSIRSESGETYFDLENNEVGGRINFKDGIVSGDIGVTDGSGAHVAGINGKGGEKPMIYAGKETRRWYAWKAEDGSVLYKKSEEVIYGIGTNLCYLSPYGKSVYANNITGNVLGISGKQYYRDADSDEVTDSADQALFRVMANGKTIYGNKEGMRVEIDANGEAAMKIFDDNNDLSAIFSGKSYTQNELFGTSTATKTDIFASKNYSSYSEKNITDTHNIGSFTLDYKAKVTITSDLSFSPRFTFPNGSYVKAIYYLDDIVLYQVLVNESPKYSPITFEGILEKGTHELKLEVEYHNTQEGVTTIGYSATIAASSVVSVYSFKGCHYFSNGNAVGITASENVQTMIINGKAFFQVVNTDNQTQLNGISGLRLHNGQMFIKNVDDWREVYIDGNNLKLR